MRAAVKRLGDVTVISIEGMLEIEYTQPFREVCLHRFLGQKLVFNMSQTHFVGSTGLNSFLDTVQKIDAGNTFGLKLVGVKPEFRRLFASLETQRLSFFEDIDRAVVSFSQPAPVAEPANDSFPAESLAAPAADSTVDSTPS
jgi:anti-anti-sigma factor